MMEINIKKTMDCGNKPIISDFPMVYADIGGSLVKVAFIVPLPLEEEHQKIVSPPHNACSSKTFDSCFCPHLTIESPLLGGRIFFYVFPVAHNLDLFLSFLSSVFPRDTLKGRCLHFTGGGALKYADILKKVTLAERVQYHDELQTVVGGLEFLSKLRLKDELYELTSSGLNPFTGVLDHFLLVQIGSGTSIVEVTGNKATRIDGSALGGATFMGLGASISETAQSFNELITSVRKGNANSVDLLVGDICNSTTYLDVLGADVLAACGGKMRGCVGDIDSKIASILRMLVINTIHISALNAKMTNSTIILLSGGFMDSIDAAIGYYADALAWYGQGRLKGLVAKHHAFLGVLGILTTLIGWSNVSIQF